MWKRVVFFGFFSFEKYRLDSSCVVYISVMSIHFIFSDEAGDYCEARGTKFLKANPYFIRASVMIEGDAWAVLRDMFQQIQMKYRFPTNYELKWCYIGSIMAHRKRGESIPDGRRYSAFRDWSNDELLGFVEDTVGLLRMCDFCRVVYTLTDNGRVPNISSEKLYKMHIMDLMQRVELELAPKSGLGVIFLDPKDQPTDSLVRAAYTRIYQDGDFIDKYLHIADSLSFVFSDQSFGIRFADYLAGIFNNFLRGYPQSEELFKKAIWPIVRKSPIGNPLGWGICEVPSDVSVREKIKERLVSSGLVSSGKEQESML